MNTCSCRDKAENIHQAHVLRWLLLINAVMFVVESVVGFVAQSTGLIADSLDMLADSTVYGIALYAVGQASRVKIRAAQLSGLFQVFLAFGVLIDVVRRVLLGSEPISMLMIGFGFVALLANLVCLYLIAEHRGGEIHMRASWVFSRNDVLANLGVIAGGVMVAWLQSPIPDLLIGGRLRLW